MRSRKSKLESAALRKFRLSSIAIAASPLVLFVVDPASAPQDRRSSTVLDRVSGIDLFALIERLGGGVFGFCAAVHHLDQCGLKKVFGVHLGSSRVISREERDRFREK